jgi:endonuclease YncB( thermonuclease family)
MHPTRWVASIACAGLILALAVAFSSTTMRPVAPVQAQEATPAATAETSPTATGAASVFMSGIWRISVVFAARNSLFPELELTASTGRDWIVTVVDVTNWSQDRETLLTNRFNTLAVGAESPSGFHRINTERLAAELELEPEVVKDGLEISAGSTERLILVFRVNSGDREFSLIHTDGGVPLAPALARGGSLDTLPDLTSPPKLTPSEVVDTLDGITLQLESGPFRLAGVDAPLGDDCFASQSTRRLERMAGDQVFVEEGSDPAAAAIWVEDEEGLRTLLNREAIVTGSAATTSGFGGAYGAWLQDAERIARASGLGLWASCTNQHGTVRQRLPEMVGLTLETSGAASDYAVWVAWAPAIVTKPDGSAYVFYSAEPTLGEDVGKKRLFVSRYDPSTDAWSASTAVPGGAVQMGPATAVDADGVVHVVFCDRAEDKAGVYTEIMYMHEDGKGGWTLPEPVARDAAAGFQLSPSIAIDRAGVIHVAWQDQRAFDVQARDQSASNADAFMSDLEPGGKWSIPVLVNTHYPDAAASRPQVVADGDRLVMIWSVYAASLGLNAAARVEWSSRPLDDPVGWRAPEPVIIGRGEGFGGRLLDIAADPTGGVVLVYGRQATDTFLFLRRLPAGSTEWGGDTLLTFGNRGAFPSVTINDDGLVYVVYNVGTGSTVDVGAVAIPYRSIQPGPEVILTEDQPDTQGRPIVATDITGRPWIVYFNEPPGGIANEVRVLRNANVPVEVQ